MCNTLTQAVFGEVSVGVASRALEHTVLPMGDIGQQQPGQQVVQTAMSGEDSVILRKTAALAQKDGKLIKEKACYLSLGRVDHCVSLIHIEYYHYLMIDEI